MSYLTEMQDELGGELGDPRRCRRHPWETTSSADGMHDAPCGCCEYENETGIRITERPDGGLRGTGVLVPTREPCRACGGEDSQCELVGVWPYTHRVDADIPF